MGGIERGGNWRKNAAATVGTLGGLGLLGYYGAKALTPSKPALQIATTPFYSATSSGFPATPFFSTTSAGFPDIL